MDYKISVVVPVYKVKDRMLKTLECLKNQTFKEFEVLFIDDGSPDDSSDFANNYLENTDVHYRIIKKQNGGVSSARNLGIEEAKGEYIQFLDSDDYVEEDFLARLYNKVIEQDSDIVYSGYVFEDYKGNKIYDNKSNLREGMYSGKEASLGLIYGYAHTHIMANLFRKSLIIENNIRFDENRKFAEDISFVIKAYSNADKVYCLNEVNTHYVKWEESVTNNVSINLLDTYYSYVETLEYLKENIKNKELEKAMIEFRIPVGIMMIYSAFITKNELNKELYKFIDNKKVREDLSKYKIYKFNKDRIKYYILSKLILYKPEIAKKYYLKK